MMILLSSVAFDLWNLNHCRQTQCLKTVLVFLRNLIWSENFRAALSANCKTEW